MKIEITKMINEIAFEMGLCDIKFDLETSEHADFACNIAFQAKKILNESPIQIAQKIVEKLKNKFGDVIDCIAANPGFINVFLKPKTYANFLNSTFKKGLEVGKGEKNNKRINIEYVSANPTGYLHVGHARNAAIGSSLANIMEYSGYTIDREFYINDAGNQINTMAFSVYFRYMELFNKKIDPQDEMYRGEDIKACATALKKEVGQKYLEMPFEKCRNDFREFGLNFYLNKIKEHLNNFRAKFNIFYSERTISRETINKTIAKLKNSYTKDGAIWFKSTIYGDDKDRVLIKSDGSTTYFAPDVVYHSIKASRHDYEELIDIWGADHSGYIARMRYALEDLGFKKGLLNVLTMQMVKLTSNNTNVKMSKRRGTAVTLESLVSEIGVDAARYYLTNKATNSEIEIDIDLSRSAKNENHVFYIQYAHARANQLLKKAGLDNKQATIIKTIVFDGEELLLVRKLLNYAYLIQDIAKNKQIQLLNTYLFELSKHFHSFYASKKIMDLPNVGEYLTIVTIVKNVIQNGLGLLGITAPERM